MNLVRYVPAFGWIPIVLAFPSLERETIELTPFLPLPPALS